ncbi:MAG: CDGSH-type Zn-finger protein [Paraglaciecola sp.]|jgi:CDGSH-type Zn-finger protein
MIVLRTESPSPVPLPRDLVVYHFNFQGRYNNKNQSVRPSWHGYWRYRRLNSADTKVFKERATTYASEHGKSGKQPFCDGSHGGSDFPP